MKTLKQFEIDRHQNHLNGYLFTQEDLDLYKYMMLLNFVSAESKFDDYTQQLAWIGCFQFQGHTHRSSEDGAFFGSKQEALTHAVINLKIHIENRRYHAVPKIHS